MQITPDPVVTEPEVKEESMGGSEGDKRSEEKGFSYLLLKAMRDLSQNIEGMG